MKKILLKINKKEELSYPADGYIVGIKKFSFLFGLTFSIDEIKKIKEETDKEIYVSFNKLIFNDELSIYKKILLEIDKIGVDGIIIGDIAGLTYNLKTPVILDQLHLNNSYYAINEYNEIDGVILTNDITREEINEISQNTNKKLFKQVFGYAHLSTSKRRLITNYLDNFKINSNSDIYEISEENSDNYYKIIEDDFGCHILSDKPLNLLGTNLDTDYYIIDGLLLDDVKEVLNIFKINDISKKEFLDQKYTATDGFINKKTIYKVKKDEE